MTVLTPGSPTARSLDPGTVRERVAAHMLADGFEFSYPKVGSALVAELPR